MAASVSRRSLLALGGSERTAEGADTNNQRRGVIHGELSCRRWRATITAAFTRTRTKYRTWVRRQRDSFGSCAPSLSALTVPHFPAGNVIWWHNVGFLPSRQSDAGLTRILARRRQPGAALTYIIAP